MLEAFLSSLQKACLPGVWSKGVALQREGAVIAEPSQDPTQLHFRVRLRDRPVAPKVSFWLEDEDAYCDCGDRNEVCAHIAAAVIALRSGGAKLEAPTARSLEYHFYSQAGALRLERWIGGAGQAPERLAGTLVAYAGGASSGRIAAKPVTAIQADFAIDSLLGIPPRELLEPPAMRKLLGLLDEHPRVSLDGRPIAVSSRALGMRARVSAERGGYRIVGELESAVAARYLNGAALSGESLRPLPETDFSEKYFPPEQAQDFITRILPELERRMPVEKPAGLPRAVEAEPRIRFKSEKLEGEILGVLAELSYVRTPELTPLLAEELPIRDEVAENALVRRLQSELHLRVGHWTRFEGARAVDFALRLRAWEKDAASGSGAAAFALAPSLEPELELDEHGVLRVSLGGRAEFARLLEAWKNGEQYVSLLDGGWAPLPLDWLERFGSQVEGLLAAQDSSGKVPAYRLPEVVRIAEECGDSSRLPAALRELGERLESARGIPRAELPLDLRAELRSYQRDGIDWLCLLRDSEMGALLADDMGLGKTLQALCALRGRSLIVAPTSVLESWREQIERFRPALRSSVYHGGGRQLDPQADVTLTTYAILRLDLERLAAVAWETVILDEAQTIKNPESQVAQAAFKLQGRFRLALSGTPVENRLDDLWSQFEFLNPGLLGTRAEFQATWVPDPKRLRERIRPFILRRLKREVATELPPRTEIVLHAELSDAERQVYEAILAATRADVVARFEKGGNVLAILEALLRLRQACCHPALVPGGGGAGPSSSKIDLLLATLENSLPQGHRALVFSQWTSFLDLLEPRLSEAGVSFSRLDGSTRDRGAVVAEFQRPDGPSVMLISLKAGGVGLTLTAADHIFLMDPWWNPATEDQAADRAHRIGQVNPVLIHRIVARETLEERILILQKSKREMADAVLHESQGSLALTRDNILSLLEPV